MNSQGMFQPSDSVGTNHLQAKPGGKGIPLDNRLESSTSTRVLNSRLLLPSFLCLAILLSSCAPYHTAGHAYTFNQGQRNGLIIVSFTVDNSFLGTQEQWEFENLNGKKRYGFLEAQTKWGRTPLLREIYDGNTMLHVVELPEGDYEFNRWKGAYGSISFSMGFKSVAGKASYLGHLEVHPTGENRARISIRDDRETDLPLFKKHYQHIKDAEIDCQILK